MAELNVTVVHSAPIRSLSDATPKFLFLNDVKLPRTDDLKWPMNGKQAYCIQAMFIGKTGYGKSTTLNGICGGR